MKRRPLIAGICAALAAAPLSARAQRTPMPVVGFLASIEPTRVGQQLTGIRQGLGDAGYVEGKTLAIEIRSAEGLYDRLPGMAADLVARKVDVIIAQGPPAARAAKAATATVPIVFGVGVDPVAEGLVASLARPGGNLTGVTLLNSELMAKRFAVMLELAPKARLIALLVNPTMANPWIASVEDLARARGVRLLIVKASTPGEIDATFATMAREGAEALVVGEDTFLSGRRQIAELALRHRLPSISLLRSYPEIGGLASYGTNLTEAYRQIGTMAGRILKGANPADIAVQQAAKFEMVLNLKTARALGVEIAPLMLARADEVIE
jgi:putative ABC transport system substrate-binding protein